MDVSAVNSSSTAQWLQQLLSGVQTPGASQSCSPSASAPSDSANISQEAVQMNATQTQPDQSTTVKGGHHGHHRHHGGAQGSQSPISQLAQDIVNDLQNAATNGTASGIG